MESKLHFRNDSNDNNIEINTFQEECKSLKMLSIPTFGKYSKDYLFLEQVLVLKSKYQPDLLPPNIKSKLDILKNNHPKMESPSYFQITLSTSSILSSSNDEINSSYTLLNLLAHPYIFYNSELNKEHKSEIYCAAFTDEEELDTIKEAEDKDILRINPNCNLDDHQLKREVILHLSEDGYPSLSPNNCGILVNLNSQIINFYVIVCGTYGSDIVKCFVGNFIIIPNATNSVLFGELYKKFVGEKDKEKLGIELILFRNKYFDYMNYIFNFGLNEIIANAKNLEHIKMCLNKAFSLIFDFSIIGDENDENTKNSHEKEISNMQNYYYNNVCNFIFGLYKDSKNVDPNFPEKFMESCLKKKCLEELLLKYSQYTINRINNIILIYEHFIFENENGLNDLQDKGDEIYVEEVLPNLKSYFSDILNTEEERLDEIKDSFNEENRIHKDNPNIEILINICNSIRNEEDYDLDDLDEIMKKYLFYIVWVYKNKPMGVHNDFGKESFMNGGIDKKYYCDNNDKIKCCQLLIEYLENADVKQY